MPQLQQARKSRLRKGYKIAETVMAYAVVAAAVASGCSEPAPPPPAPVASAPKAQPSQSPAQTPAPAAAPAPAPAAPEYSYKPAGRRDPFMPLIVKEEKSKTVNRPPLERYNISEFKFTGIVWGGFGYNAILEAPDGKGYFIRKGTVVGPNGGVVKSISSKHIIVEEKYKTFTGETRRKEIIVEMRKRQEGMP